jgi:hypothetical protein
MKILFILKSRGMLHMKILLTHFLTCMQILSDNTPSKVHIHRAHTRSRPKNAEICVRGQIINTFMIREYVPC